jgi:anhydro-N-acetylmuramic acid kinase
MKKELHVIGIMSGTSMDGVDIAYVILNNDNGYWSYACPVAETIPYEERWRIRLSQLYKQPIFLYPKTSAFYGKFMGQLVNQFIAKYQIKPDLISSHGHTIFHQPDAGFTAQIGDGAAINAITGLPVVCDFRTTDVALGGQGAPLVPIGDQLLFSAYDACLNLGGIANISLTGVQSIKAFDIAPCNIVLNRVARWLNMAYDNEGKIAAAGVADEELLNKLNDLDYYHLQTAKSLGREWINEVFWPVVKSASDISETNMMATLSAHIAFQIKRVLEKYRPEKMLITGGGAFNTHLIEQVQQQQITQIHIPDEQTIQYKEAIIFALLGLLRVKNLNNSLKSVTGASRNSIGGALYGDFSALI